MSKIIVIGATGFIGNNVVKQCINHKSVKEVIVLARRPINEELLKSPKVNMIIHEEFSQYPNSLLEQLKGADGCIWTIGGAVDKFPDLDTAKKVGIGYTLVAAEAFRDNLAPLVKRKPFRFVYCSVWGAERNQIAKLWSHADSRKIKGAAESGLIDLQNSSGGTFEAFMLRPGTVFSEESGIFGAGASNFLPTIRVDNLAKALVQVCLVGADDHTLENREINEVGGLGSTLMVNSLPF